MNTHERALMCISANDVIGFRTVLAKIDATAHHGELLWAAANLGHVEILQDLLVVANPEHFEDALLAAVRFERDDCISLLLQHIIVPPDSALWMACEQNNLEQVHQILPHCNIYENTCVLELAVRTKNQELFDQVYEQSNLDQWKSHLSGTGEQREALRNNFQALYLHYRVHDDLAIAPSAFKRKI